MRNICDLEVFVNIVNSFYRFIVYLYKIVIFFFYRIVVLLVIKEN